MQKPSHRFYFTLVLFTVIVNLIVYLQFTETIAKTTNKQADKNIALRNGDLVLRNSKGLIASVFRNSSLQHRKYTHAGLLYQTNNQWLVYHIIDDETKSGLHVEKLSQFIKPQTCNGYAYYRYILDTKQEQRLDSLIAITKKQSIRFDPGFDLSTDSIMYCSEWIAKTLAKASGNNQIIPKTTVGEYFYIAPDNLYLNEHCNLLYHYEY